MVTGIKAGRLVDQQMCHGFCWVMVIQPLKTHGIKKWLWIMVRLMFDHSNICVFFMMASSHLRYVRIFNNYGYIHGQYHPTFDHGTDGCNVEPFTRPGKQPHNYGKVHNFLMGKSTISMAMFNSKQITRGYIPSP